jgi:LacI family transcriptional regulator
MRDVARAAGVSLKTVSRVINGEAAVAPPTAARVAEAIAELGFERNDLARSLRRGHSSGTLGLVIEDVANPFYSVVAQAVEDAARERGLLLITASAREDPEREYELATALLRRRVDALLMVPTGADHHYLLRRNGDDVTVFLDRPPGGIDADTVIADNAGGARAATMHLIERGHSRIALVADDAALYTARERVAGYRAALAAAGIGADPRLMRSGNHDAEAAQATVEALLGLPEGERPTAILAANNRITVGAVRALAGDGDPIALVGFDDFELADVLRVTVVRFEPRLMGLRAAELAFARLDGDERPPRRVTIPTELVMRGSGERGP